MILVHFYLMWETGNLTFISFLIHENMEPLSSMIMIKMITNGKKIIEKVFFFAVVRVTVSDLKFFRFYFSSRGPKGELQGGFFC